MRRYIAISLALFTAQPGAVRAADPTDLPRPIPLTRPEMKQLIEDMKARKPRIPLPELTEDDRKKLEERGAGATGYEGRLRFHYMPGSESGRGGGGSFGLGNDPDMTLDNTFKVQLFWLVCRANNCQYCQGHQEGKLLRAGQKEDEIAALDGDWSEFTVAQQTAFAFARKITYEPHRITDADIEGLRKHYKDAQMLEMILSVAGNNAINRWKEGTGVPQSAGGGGSGGKQPKEPVEKHTYLTPTSDKYKDTVTKVAPLFIDEKSGKPTRLTVARRPALESREDTEKALAAARKRTSRLPLVAEDKSRALLPADYTKGDLPDGMRCSPRSPPESRESQPVVRGGEGRPEAAFESTGELDHRAAGSRVVRGRTREETTPRPRPDRRSGLQARRRLEGLHRDRAGDVHAGAQARRLASCAHRRRCGAGGETGWPARRGATHQLRHHPRLVRPHHRSRRASNRKVMTLQ